MALRLCQKWEGDLPKVNSIDNQVNSTKQIVYSREASSVARYIECTKLRVIILILDDSRRADLQKWEEDLQEVNSVK